MHISIASNMRIIDGFFSGTSRPVVILVGGELSVSVGPLNGPME